MQVKEEEVSQIRAQLDVEGIENPEIAAILVGKRHHTRLFKKVLYFLLRRIL